MVEWIFEIAAVLTLILLSPALSRLFRIPTIVVEVLLGMIVGPSMLALIGTENWLITMATIGFIYLMFIVGLEIDVEYLGGGLVRILVISLTSFLIPLFLGALAAQVYGLPPLFIGITLSTTSMGVVLPTIKEISHSKDFSQILLGSAIVVDILSMFALTYVVESLIVGRTTIVILLAVLALFILLIFVVRHLNATTKVFGKFHNFSGNLGVRVALALIFTLAAISEIVGIHAIIGSFFAGLVISELFGEVENLIEQLLSFGYGFFIPLFFIYVGINTNLPAIILNLKNLEILMVFIAVGYLAKIVATSLASWFLGFNRNESLVMGFAMSARLSLVAVAAEIGLSLGLIDIDMYSVLILLAIISLIISPTLAKYVMGKSRVKIPEEELV